MDFSAYAKSYQSKICLETQRVELLISKCDHPDKAMRIIHVAGTNGKGSVCSFIAQGLVCMGETVGRFSSPELFCVCDTISVDNVFISEQELDEIYEYLEPKCREVEAELGQKPSQFEINFVASLVYFKNKGCTRAVIECGMGGTGDATTAIEDSYASVLTGISLDHCSYLGQTIEEIAANKCGIIKKSSLVFTTDANGAVMDTISRCTLPKEVMVSSTPICKTDGLNSLYPLGKEKIKLSLAGVHQCENAALAHIVLKELGATDDAVAKALSTAKNPARLEQIKPGVYFDGAHNPDGTKALVDSINALAPKSKVIFVTGFMADKDYQKCLLHLRELKGQDFEIYTTTVHSNSRSETATKLCACAASLGFCAKAFPDVNTAISEAQKNADLVFVFGSLYMYKEVTK